MDFQLDSYLDDFFTEEKVEEPKKQVIKEEYKAEEDEALQSQLMDLFGIDENTVMETVEEEVVQETETFIPQVHVGPKFATIELSTLR